MELLLVWFAAAVLAGIAANARGRSGFGWFLLALLLSPLCLLAVLVMRNLRAEEERREIARIAGEAARPRDIEGERAAEEAARLRALEPWRDDARRRGGS